MLEGRDLIMVFLKSFLHGMSCQKLLLFVSFSLDGNYFC